MTNPAWKRTEREVARRLGGTRVPVSGRQRGDQPDVAHDVFSVEVKHKASLPGWLKDALAQATASKRGEQTPLVVLHEDGARFDGALCVLTLRDLLALLDGSGSSPASDERGAP